MLSTVSKRTELVEAFGAGLLTEIETTLWFCKSVVLRLICSSVELTTVVGFEVPFHKTAEFPSNPVPVMVIVAGAVPGIVCGEMDAIAGVGLFTLKLAVAETPPPGVGFCTVI